LSKVQSSSEPNSPVRLSWFFRETFLEFLWLSLFFLVLPVSLWMLPRLALFSGLLIAASLWMMQRIVGLFHLRRLTIPTFFYFLYIAIILIPGFFIFSEEITPSRWRFLFAIESVVVTVPLGIWFANLWLGFQSEEAANYFHRPVAIEPLGAPAKRIYIAFLAMGFVLVLMNLWETPAIPLLYLIHNPGDFLAAAILREDSFKILNSHFTYAYYVLRGTVLPFLIMLAFGRYCLQKQELWRRLFLTSLFLGIFYAAITIEKSPVSAILGLLGIFYYLIKGGKLGKAAALLLPLLFLVFPLTVLLLAYNGSEGGTLSGALQAIGHRLFYSPAQVVYGYFEVFPAVIPFQHGASIVKLAHLMGWKAVDIPNLVGLYMTDGQDLDTITANSCFIGNFNADFGLPGVVLAGVLAGFVMQFVNVHLFRQPKTVVNLAAYAICMWAFGMLVASPLSTVLLSGGVAFSFVLRWFFRDRARVLPSEDLEVPSSSLRPPLRPTCS
jgi:oligosaccharide repeat unit polymerase